MKNLFNSYRYLLVILILTACSGNSPKHVAEKFLEAYSRLDFEGAKKYGTDETAKLLDMMNSLTKLMNNADKKMVKTEVISEKIDGDKATVIYKEEGKEGDQVLNLVKVNGSWKVALSKDTMNDGGPVNMDSGATTTDTTGEVPADTLK